MASIRKRDDSWQVQIRKHGQRSVTKSFKSKANALAWARRTESEIERGLVSPDFRRSTKVTLEALINRYIDTVTPRKQSRIQETNRLRKLCTYPISKLVAANVTAEDIAKFRDLRLSHVGSQAVRHDLNALSQVLTIAKREWSIPLSKNPIDGLWKPPISPSQQRRLSDKETKALNVYLTDECNTDFKNMVSVALCTGMRKGEILRIRAVDIIRSKGLLHIPLTKNGHPRTIPLCSKATAILMERSKQFGEVLFPYDEPWCRYHWSKLLVRTGISNLHFHDLRHEAISRFFEKGLSVPEVALISGHRDYRMLARHTHLRAEDVARKLGEGA